MFAILIVILGFAGSAHAHQSSIKYVSIKTTPAMSVAFTVATTDLTEPMGLATDSVPPIADAIASPAVPPFVAAWVAFAGCRAGTPSAKPDAEGRFVVVSWDMACDDPKHLTLDFARFFALDQRHEAIVTLDDGEPTIVRAKQPVVSISATESPSLLGWIGYGMHHIYDGRDHISFVLSLLLVLVLMRVPGGGTLDWQTRPFKQTLRATATIITAFTIAHSLSLIAASLGWIRLPSKLVESIIAISIAYTAFEDVVKPDVKWRFYLTFGFGLIHGLGFASALEELLPADHVLAPLLLFNVGVELGQLTVVIVVLPVLWIACNKLGATRYRRGVMPALASLIFGLGVVWLVERIADVRILGL